MLVPGVDEFDGEELEELEKADEWAFDGGVFSSESRSMDKVQSNPIPSTRACATM